MRRFKGGPGPFRAPGTPAPRIPGPAMSARLPAPATGRWPGPKEILALSASEADELLDRLESNVPVRPGLFELTDPRLQTGVVFGDTHGDWRSTTAPVERFLSARSTDAL